MDGLAFVSSSLGRLSKVDRFALLCLLVLFEFCFNLRFFVLFFCFLSNSTADLSTHAQCGGCCLGLPYCFCGSPQSV